MMSVDVQIGANETARQGPGRKKRRQPDNAVDPGVRQAAGEPFPETVAVLESLIAAKGARP